MKSDARTEGLRWLEQAEADRHGAQLLFDGGSFHLACFVAQQVAEKALKAFREQYVEWSRNPVAQRRSSPIEDIERTFQLAADAWEGAGGFQQVYFLKSRCSTQGHSDAEGRRGLASAIGGR
jgi:hypothetical protein